MQEADKGSPHQEQQPLPSNRVENSPLENSVNPAYISEPQISSELAPPPPWYKETAKTVLDAWFDPKSFENEETYERLGIKHVKKWLPSTGDKVYKSIWMRLGFPRFITRRDDLKRIETFTRVYEAMHIAAFGVLTEQAAENFANGRIGVGIFATTVNALVNVYPIMLQRYNRIRLYKTINRTEARKSLQNQTEPSSSLEKEPPDQSE